MKKRNCSLYIFLFTALMFNSARANICHDGYTKISDYLKQKIDKLVWVDVNPTIGDNGCKFTIRYFPCDPLIQNQIDKILPQAIKYSAPNCSLRSKGQHSATQGYCTLENVLIDCDKVAAF